MVSLKSVKFLKFLKFLKSLKALKFLKSLKSLVNYFLSQSMLLFRFKFRCQMLLQFGYFISL